MRYNLVLVLTSGFLHSNILGDKILDLGGNLIIENEDYCRHEVLHLLIEEIKSREVSGKLAEFGVYQGDFSKYINSTMLERKLYLFDTFERFSNEQEENISREFSTKQDIRNSSFTDTSV